MHAVEYVEFLVENRDSRCKGQIVLQDLIQSRYMCRVVDVGPRTYPRQHFTGLNELRRRGHKTLQIGVRARIFMKNAESRNPESRCDRVRVLVQDVLVKCKTPSSLSFMRPMFRAAIRYSRVLEPICSFQVLRCLVTPMTSGIPASFSKPLPSRVGGVVVTVQARFTCRRA